MSISYLFKGFTFTSHLEDFDTFLFGRLNHFTRNLK